MSSFTPSTITSVSEADITRLAWPEDVVIGRDKEQAEIEQALDRVLAKDAQAEALIIHGASGSGKSYLAKQALSKKTQAVSSTTKYIVGHGKYNQSSNSAIPYEAITSAVSEICQVISNDQELLRTTLERLAAAVEPNEIEILSGMVPAIGRLASTIGISKETECKTLILNETTIIRFNNLFRRFLRSFVSPECPLVLFLDDLQWADDASRRLLASISKDPKLKNILLLGSVRDGEPTTFALDPDAIMQHRKVVCGALSVQAATGIVANALSHDAKTTMMKELGEVVHERCSGNPFFIIQYIEQLCRMKQLWFSEATNTFEWDTSAIVADTGSQADFDVVDILVGKINGMSRSAKALMIVFAQVGHSIEEDTITRLLACHSLVSLLNTVIDDDGFAGREINVKKAIKECKPRASSSLSMTGCNKLPCE